MENKLSHQYNWNISYEIVMNISNVELWKIISSPSNLELFHPFCSKNNVINWPGKNSIDHIHYYNGMILERNFVNWYENKGYDLFIGEKNKSKSYVEWRIDDINHNQSKIKITIYPHIYNLGNIFKNFFPFFFFIRPNIKKYVKQVLYGLQWYVLNKEKISKNQFGSNIFFSP